MGALMTFATIPSAHFTIPDRWVGLFCLAILFALAVRIMLVYRETGRFPVRLDRPDTVDGIVRLSFAAVASLFAVNLLLLRLPSWLSAEPGTAFAALYDTAGRIEWLETPAARAAGFLLAGAGLVIAALAQHQMGKNWRVGLDHESQTSIVADGLFAYARHPIYIGFLAVDIGVFLMMPTALTLAAVAMLVVALAVAARTEEAFMLERHGEPYRAYLERTPRWL